VKSIAVATILAAVVTLSGHDVSKKVEERYDKIENMSMDFSQEIAYASLDEKSVFHGHILLSKPDRMRMSVLEPDTQILISSSGSLWIYLKSAKQALFYDLTEESYPQVSSLIFNMSKEFESTVVGRTQKRFLVKLLPREESKYYDSLYAKVSSRSHIVTGLSVFDRQRNRIDYDFTRIRTNVEIPDSLFRFNPPPGTEIIKRQ
jgi:outer membrane lipoprotein carrier protein